MTPQLRDSQGAASGDAGLRSTEQLVPAERHDIRPIVHGLLDRLLTPEPEARGIEQRAAAEVVDERDAALVRELRQIRRGGLGHEAPQREVARVDPEDRRGLGGDRIRVVAHVGAVRGPDLDELGPRPHQHVGDPEAAADLHQLATRDDHLASSGDRREREQHRRRAVVHDDRILGAGDLGEQARGVPVPLPAGPTLEVVLDAHRAARLADRRDRDRGERSPAEIRVEDHARRVEHRPQCARVAPGETIARELRVRRCIEGLVAGGARLGEDLPHGCDEALPLTRSDRRCAQDRVDRREGAAGIGHAVSTARAAGRTLIDTSLAWITSPSISIAARRSSAISTVRARIAWMVVPLWWVPR